MAAPTRNYDNPAPIELSAKTKNLSGQKFGRLLCLFPVERRKNAHIVYRCLCDCGVCIYATCSNLKYSHTTSCGCWQKEITGGTNSTHGRAKTRLYRRWCQMIQRCHRPYAPNYIHYGGRGISVCNRWRESFEAFAEDMGEPPPGTWIERVDNDGPYAPWNCIWAHPKEQAKNTRRALNAVELTARGKTQKLSEWASEIGVDSGVLRHRMRRGWSADRIVSTPKRERVSHGL